jgi:hypothetical protein
MKKKHIILIVLLLLLIISCSIEDEVPNDDEINHDKDVVVKFEDYVLEHETNLLYTKQFKYRGPGTVQQAEVIFTKYVEDWGWDFDKKEVNFAYNTLYFKKASFSSSLTINLGRDYPVGILVIIDIPHQ